MVIGRWVGICWLTCAVATLSVHAEAANNNEGTSRAAARTLGYAGVKDYQGGDYAAALDKLERAYAVLHAPALALWSARALVKQGKLVEGAERYMEATRLDVSTGDVQVQKKAQADALAEHEQLVPRIPTLVLVLEGADAADVRLLLDGKELSTALFGQSLQVNPGDHKIEAVRGDENKSEDVTIAESSSRTVTLRFTPRPAGEATPSERVPQNPEQKPENLPQPPAKKNVQKTVGWVAIGVGGAGLVASGVTALLALNKKSSLGSSCADGRCDPAVHDDVDAYNRLRTISTIGYIAGGVFAGTGIVLVLTAKPKQESAPAARVSVRGFVGLNQVGVSGEF